MFVDDYTYLHSHNLGQSLPFRSYGNSWHYTWSRHYFTWNGFQRQDNNLQIEIWNVKGSVGLTEERILIVNSECREYDQGEFGNTANEIGTSPVIVMVIMLDISNVNTNTNTGIVSVKSSNVYTVFVPGQTRIVRG